MTNRYAILRRERTEALNFASGESRRKLAFSMPRRDAKWAKPRPSAASTATGVGISTCPIGRATSRSAMLKQVWHCSRLIGAFSEHKLAPRPDGISNAVTTFDKDNYLMIEYE